MEKRRLFKPLCAVGLLLFVAFAVGALLAPDTFFPFNAGKMSVLTENAPGGMIERSQLVEPAKGDETVRFVVGLKLRDEADLDRFLDQVADPASPTFGNYLTAEQFRDRYSPAVDDVDAVLSYLASHGMTVLSVSDNRTLIHVEATVEQIEVAFAVEMNVYAADGETFISNDRSPSIPRHLNATVQSIIGLNTGMVLESHMRYAPQAPNTANTPPRGLSPQEVARVYDYPNANNNKAENPLTGAGKTIAIATAHIYDINDIQEFWKQFGIVRTGTLTDVHVAGKSTTLNGETTLDLEAASAQAPGADIIMYMSVDPKFVNFTLTFNKIVTDNKADVMSISWGLCEEFTGTRQMKSESKIFKQAAAQGMAVFAASGDYGAYDCSRQVERDDDGNVITPAVSVDYPSSDPYVVAVGGTTLFEASDRRILEYAWHGSGGGVSKQWKRPSWQHGPGIPPGKKRVTADISLNADPMTGYAIYFQGKWSVIGGTSVSAPKWAALWALFDEGANKRIGSPHDVLYRAARSADYDKIFHDITTGDNGNYRGPGYKAGTKWDHPTGWGVPKGQPLKDWVVKDQNPSASGSGNDEGKEDGE